MEVIRKQAWENRKCTGMVLVFLLAACALASISSNHKLSIQQKADGFHSILLKQRVFHTIHRQREKYGGYNTLLAFYRADQAYCKMMNEYSKIYGLRRYDVYLGLGA
jgi:hypothetical protein